MNNEASSWPQQKGGNRGYMRDLVANDSPSEDWARRTYILTQDLADRLEAVGREHQVGLSDLVRFLLAVGLDQVDAGELSIPTRAASLRVIDYDPSS